jgi:CheY-like chemotaxis protein
MWLERAGFDVVIAESGESALALSRSTAFDLLVIDMVMPGMGGLKAIEAIRQLAPAMPIIAMSGFMFADSPSAYSDFPKLAQAAGATLCLRKPFRPSELVAQIRRCLGGSHQPVGTAVAS